MKIMVAALLALAPLCGALAQPYPSKPLRIIVPFTPGSATDTMARPIAERLSSALGQPVVVENRPGAGGTIGIAALAKSPPDGYTLAVVSTGHVVNPVLYANLPYDTLKDFAGVAPLAGLPSVLVVSPELGVRSVRDLVAMAKAKPGQLNYARSEEHTSELQSQSNLVCRLLLEKKKRQPAGRLQPVHRRRDRRASSSAPYPPLNSPAIDVYRLPLKHRTSPIHCIIPSPHELTACRADRHHIPRCPYYCAKQFGQAAEMKWIQDCHAVELQKDGLRRLLLYQHSAALFFYFFFFFNVPPPPKFPPFPPPHPLPT